MHDNQRHERGEGLIGTRAYRAAAARDNGPRFAARRTLSLRRAPAMTHAAAPATVGSPWFRSAPYDLLWILAVPVFTWPLVMLGQQAWGAPLLNQLILLTATGHYFATFVRAYGDERLFERFRVRFLLAPAVLLATCVGMFATGNAAPLLVVTAGWAFWHWLAQAFGFARIYDAKIGSFRPLTAWLDRAVVIAGFVGAATLNPASGATFGRVILDAGVPLPDAGTFAIGPRWSAASPSPSPTPATSR
jgi:hypothetical protein